VASIFDSAKALVGLVIDRDFGKDAHRGAPARALLIVNASDSTTSNQLQVTPITRTQLIVGKILPFVLIGYIQTVLMVLMMGWLFDVHPQGSVAALYVLTGLYIAAVLGLGILISTIAQTQMQAGNMAMMLVMPFVFLSG